MLLLYSLNCGWTYILDVKPNRRQDSDFSSRREVKRREDAADIAGRTQLLRSLPYFDFDLFWLGFEARVLQ